MLSKSQAKAFFLTMTAGFSLVFLGLTVDTLNQVPARSHADQLTPQVVRGKELWESHNCMGCHTLLGEGAYYAPELTKVYSRRGPTWMATFLKDPEAMFPGQRKMVNYHFTDDQIADLIAFFQWIEGIDTNGFPAKPDLAPVSAAAAATSGAPASMTGAPPIVTSVCVGCHAIGGRGGNAGPALDGVASRFDRARLDNWLRDPQAVKPGTAMPNLNLDDATRTAVVDWLLTLH
jgi:nitric oxide reductase subunit C